jgi:hypothetical protein
MAGLIPWFATSANDIFAIKDALDNRLIAEAIAKKVVTANSYIVRDIMPKSDFGATYYDYEEWETKTSIGGSTYVKAVDVTLDGDKLIGFYGALGPSTQGDVAIKFQVGTAKVIDIWQVQATRVGVYTDDAGKVFNRGFLGVCRPGEQIVYDKKDNIVIYYYGTESAAADDTTVLLGRVIEPVGKTAMGSGALAKTRAGLLPWFMVTPADMQAKIQALDRELERRAIEQGVVERGNFVIRDILPATDFGTDYYAHENWTGVKTLTAHTWTTIVSTDLDGDKLMGFYGYLGPDYIAASNKNGVSALRFSVGTAQVKDVWMLEQTRRGELYTKTSASNAYMLGNTALTQTPIIFNGEDTVTIEAYGIDGLAGTEVFYGIPLGRVIEPKGRVIKGG